MKKTEFFKMRKELILSKMGTPKTANQIIDEIFKDDLENGMGKVLSRGWKFYVHLNKLFSPMEKDCWIKTKKLNEKNEKIWFITETYKILKIENEKFEKIISDERNYIKNLMKKMFELKPHLFKSDSDINSIS